MKIKNNDFKTGDVVKLKIYMQGRNFAGRVLKNKGETLMVSLPNGFYAELPIGLWEKVIENEIKTMIYDENIEVIFKNIAYS